MSEQQTIMDKLIAKHLQDIADGQIVVARQKLRGVLDGGPGDSSSPDYMVYAAAKAFCMVYDMQRAAKERSGE